MATPVEALRGVLEFASAPVEIDSAVTGRLAKANDQAAAAAERVHAGERLNQNRRTYSTRWHTELNRLVTEYRTKNEFVFAESDAGPVPAYPFQLRDELAVLDSEIAAFNDCELPKLRNLASIMQCVALDCRAFVYEAMADAIEQRASLLLAPAALLQGDGVDMSNSNTTSVRLRKFAADMTLASGALRAIVAARDQALAMGAKDPGVFNSDLLREWDEGFARQFDTPE